MDNKKIIYIVVIVVILVVVLVSGYFYWQNGQSMPVVPDLPLPGGTDGAIPLVEDLGEATDLFEGVQVNPFEDIQYNPFE